MLSRLIKAFLPRSKCLLISWLQSPSAVILEPQNIKSATVSSVSPSIFHEVMGPDATILVFWMLSFKPTFSLSSFTFIKMLLSSSSLSAVRVVSSAYLRLLMRSYILFKKIEHLHKLRKLRKHANSSICVTIVPKHPQTCEANTYFVSIEIWDKNTRFCPRILKESFKILEEVSEERDVIAQGVLWWTQMLRSMGQWPHKCRFMQKNDAVLYKGCKRG